ncbi:hypothetical protein MYOV003v1_p0139 [Vibrio phage 207E48.1]|nr:hypothetical protein MYOV003v1_p0139 [Vibrio phage 207E48.1]
MPSVQDFRAALQRRGGVGRQHRWRVIVNLPPFAASPDLLKDASLMALTTQTPNGVLGEISIPWGGREIPLPGDRKYEVFPITFIASEDDSVHTAFEIWQQGINGDRNNASTIANDDSMRDFTLQLLDQNDSVVKEYVLEGAWPQEVGQLELDQTAQDSYGQFTVNLRYIMSTTANSR